MQGQWGDDAPMWAVIIIMQNEAILAKLENRDTQLSPEDQQTLNSIFKTATRITKKIDDAQKT